MKITDDELKHMLINNDAHFGYRASLTSLANLSHAIAKTKGFYDDETHNTPATKIALMHEELSELLRVHRNNEAQTPDENISEYTKEELELADLLIRAFDYAGWRKLKLGDAVVSKINYNLSRPQKHNKQF